MKDGRFYYVSTGTNRSGLPLGWLFLKDIYLLLRPKAK